MRFLLSYLLLKPSLRTSKCRATYGTASSSLKPLSGALISCVRSIFLTPVAHNDKGRGTGGVSDTTGAMSAVPIATGDRGSYLNLTRAWENGDSLSFSLPMRLRVSKYTGKKIQSTGFQQVVWIVLVLDLPRQARDGNQTVVNGCRDSEIFLV